MKVKKNNPTIPKINILSNTGTSSGIGSRYNICSLTSSGTINITSTGINTTIPWSHTWTTPEIEIEIFSKKFLIKQDTFQQLYLSQIDFLGIDFYTSLKNSGLSINDESVRNYLEGIIIQKKREEKIKKII